MNVGEVQDIYNSAYEQAVRAQATAANTTISRSVSDGQFWKAREQQLAKEAKEQKIRDIRNQYRAKAYKVLAVAVGTVFGGSFVVMALHEAAAKFGWAQVAESVGIFVGVTSGALAVVEGVKWYFRRKGEAEVARFLMESE